MITAPIPLRLRRRPLDPRGYPIPFIVPFADGKADFRCSDPTHWMQSARGKRCSLCGEKIRPEAGWFVGGPSCELHRVFLDPPMHRDCAEFGLQVCPFLAAPRAHYSDFERRPPPDGYRALKFVSGQRPERFMLGRSPAWRVIPFENTFVIEAEPWEEVLWWRQGAPVLEPAQS